MVVLEWFVNATPLVRAPKTTLILGQANHHMCLLKNGFYMVVQIQPYPLSQHHPNVVLQS